MSPLESLKLIFQSQETQERVHPLQLVVCWHQKRERLSHVQHQRNSKFFFETLFPQSAVLTATLQQGVPASTHVTHLPATIPSLFNPKYKELSSAQLQEECKRVFKNEIKVTKEEAKYLPESTTLQSGSLVWHEHHTGFSVWSNLSYELWLTFPVTCFLHSVLTVVANTRS